MKYYRFPDTKLFRVGFFLFLLVIQMLTRSAIVSTAFLGFYPSQFLSIGLILLVGVAFLLVNRKQIRAVVTDSRMIAVIGIVVLLAVSMIVKQDYQAVYFSIMLYLLFAVFLSYFLPLQEAAAYYVALMTLIGVWTILGMFVLKPMVEMGWISGNPFMGVNGWFLYNFGLTFTSFLNNAKEETVRAFGIFREPGLFQVFLFVAIQLNNYTVQWKKQWHMWAVNAVLFATLLLTFATGGVFALGLYIVFLFFDKGLHRNKRICILAVLLVILLAAVLGVLIAKNGTWATELIWMVQKIFAKADSYTDRIDSVLADARIFLEHPFVGEDIQKVMYAVPNNTSSSPILFAAFGIVGGCLHVASWVALAWKKERSILMNLILLVILFIPFNTQNVVHDLFFWTFPVMALVEKGLPVLLNAVNKRKG